MMKDIENIGLVCPDCNHELSYDPGDMGGFNDPPMPDQIYCSDCGYDRFPSDDDYKKLSKIMS